MTATSPPAKTRSMGRDPEPQPPEFVSLLEATYNGRRFYGEHGSERAELTYLRDWQRWAERQLRSLNAFSSSVNEALNSGDGVYRP